MMIKKGGLKVIIRTLNESDIEQYRELRLRSLKEDPDSFLRTYEEERNLSMEFYISRFKEWSTSDSFVIGLFSNGKLIGQVGFRREDREKIKHKGTLWGMYVVPEARKSGIGKLLIEELIKRVKKIEGLEQIHLIVVQTNEPAKRLYHKLGFETYAIERRAIKIDDRYLDEEYMVLMLKNVDNLH